ncbi:MAG: 50S ribosomal protein L2 [Candidatus Berkelbacteria bacterium]|nr:50S ribosomal protein L2 [Candidatus Berkelbacteria bacterium]
MATKIIRPLTNSKRGTSYLDFSALSKEKTPKSLRAVLTKNAGRNNTGRITVAHRGGGEKRFYRLVNFGNLVENKAKIVSIDYDPNRSANIAKIEYQSGKLDYILATDKMKVGGSVECGEGVAVRSGNRTKISQIPVGSTIFNIEIMPGRGGKICRSAGNYATLLGVENNIATLKLPSSEVRHVPANCYASIGAVGNAEAMNVSFGSAGRMRHKRIRPTVRGKAKNPVDHPHGGGEGGTSIGMPGPKTPWGMPALGHRTRNKKNRNQKFIIKRRSK